MNDTSYSSRFVHLILFNKSEKDIPWKEELEGLVEESNSLLKVMCVYLPSFIKLVVVYSE